MGCMVISMAEVICIARPSVLFGEHGEVNDDSGTAAFSKMTTVLIGLIRDKRESERARERERDRARERYILVSKAQAVIQNRIDYSSTLILEF
jgi:hypothetical protein